MNEYHNNSKSLYHRFVLTGVIGAVIFVMISSVRLTGQGLYHDEAAQASASFAHIGIRPEMYSQVTIKGIPILNTAYTGAIKSNIYGLYLKFSGLRFSVKSWRLAGIIFVSIGIYLFCMIANTGMPFASLITFLLFFMTDMTVILGTRHDFGPVALGVLFRLIFIATWFYGETKKTTSKFNSFFLGFLVNIAVFEKLSSFVLVFPLILMFLFSGNRRSIAHYLSCVIGMIIGGIPLIFTNLYTFLENGELVTLTSLRIPEMHRNLDFLQLVSNYLSLGNGSLLKFVILGSDINNPYKYIDLEKYFISTILLLSTIIAICYWKQNKVFRLSGVMLLSYILLVIVLYLLPTPTWAHHWIIGTPFQYTAISFTFFGLYHMKTPSDIRIKLFQISFTSILIIFLIVRCVGLTSLEKSFFRGDTSVMFDSSITKLGHLASNRAKEAIFMAADHGIATQIYCLSNGHPNLVHELFANYKGPKQIKDIIRQTGKTIMYVVIRNPSMQLIPKNTENIFRDIDTLSDWLPGWEEVLVENELADLKAIKVRKFMYIGQ